jgi:hypothetical protein
MKRKRYNNSEWRLLTGPFSKDHRGVMAEKGFVKMDHRSLFGRIRREKGDKRWKERGSFVYFFLLFLFSFFLPATLVVFQTLNLI